MDKLVDRLQTNLEYDEFDLIRNNFIEVVRGMIADIIADKPMFDISDFDLYYCDDYSTHTNCNKVGDNILYIEISQPRNIKADQPRSSRLFRQKKVRMPKLHYELFDFRRDLFDKCVASFDSNTKMWMTKFGITLAHAEDIHGNGTYQSFKFQLIPCLSYSDMDNDNLGVIYSNEYGNNVQIEYPKLALKNFEKKNRATKGWYTKSCCILKNLLLSDPKYDVVTSKVVENIMYNVPNEVLLDDKSGQLFKLLNYIRNCSIDNCKSMDEQAYIFKDDNRSISYIYAKKILKAMEDQLKKIIATTK